MNESEKKIYTASEINANHGWDDKFPKSIAKKLSKERVFMWDDEGLNYVFDPGTKTEEDEELPNEGSTITVVPEVSNYEFNKYGNLDDNAVVNITITLSSDLLATCEEGYPKIKIDGKEFDKGHTEFSLLMNRDRRISIVWSENSIETFRLIVGR